MLNGAEIVIQKEDARSRNLFRTVIFGEQEPLPFIVREAYEWIDGSITVEASIAGGPYKGIAFRGTIGKNQTAAYLTARPPDAESQHI